MGTVKGVSSIQVFFSNSPLLRREQTKLVEKVAKSIRLSLPGEKNSRITTTAKKSIPTERPAAATKATPFARRESNIGQWGFQAAEVPANRKKLIDNKYGYPIRFLPYSETQIAWEGDMEKFKYHCFVHRPDHADKINAIISHADKYAEALTGDIKAEDLKQGRMISSAPMHALRSFIWTATELQGNKVKNSFPSDAPKEKWLDLAKFIGLHGLANYSPVDKKVKRFGAALLRKEEVRSIYADAISFANFEEWYLDKKLGKTMSNASLSSLFQVVDSLYETISVMDLYYNQICSEPSSSDAEILRTVLAGWMVYAYACRQPFFIVPADYCSTDTDSGDLPDWNVAPDIKVIEDGMYTLSGTQLVKINRNAIGSNTTIELPEGITGLMLSNDTVPDFINAFSGTRKLVYPKSLTKYIAVPPEVKEIEVNVDFKSPIISKLASESVPKLEKLTFNGRVDRIPKRAFAGLYNIRLLKFAEGLKRIDDDGFALSKIYELSLPESLREIGNSVFTLDTPERITVFKNCPALEEIKRQIRAYESYAADFNKTNAKYFNNPPSWFSEFDKKYYKRKHEKVILNITESPWETRAKSFVNKISWLYDKKDPSEVADKTVKEILTDRHILRVGANTGSFCQMHVIHSLFI